MAFANPPSLEVLKDDVRKLTDDELLIMRTHTKHMGAESKMPEAIEHEVVRRKVLAEGAFLAWLGDVDLEDHVKGANLE